jgi:glycosyltransferase involved in cell wall biosynthesis
MRILLLSQFMPPVIGGEERHVAALGEALAQRGHEVVIATQDDPARQEDGLGNGLVLRSLRGTLQRIGGLFSDPDRRHAPPFPDPELTFGLARIIHAFRPDVVHAHNWLVHSYLPLRLHAEAGFVVTLHDYSLVCARKSLMREGAVCVGPSPGRCLPCAARHYGAPMGAVTYAANAVSGAIERRLVDRFIAVSQAVAAGCGLPRGSAPFSVVPNFISDTLARLDTAPDPRLDALPSGDFMLFVGDLNRNKGAEVLLKAYAALEAAPPLVMIGRRCPDTPAELPPGVHVFESWPHAAVKHAWDRCVFGLAPSVWPEPCASVALEGQAFGKPMIVSDGGGMPDLVAHDETGFVVPTGDPAALGAAMTTLLREPARRAAMGAAARARAQRFTAGAVVPRIERIYTDILLRSRPGARAQSPYPS